MTNERLNLLLRSALTSAVNWENFASTVPSWYLPTFQRLIYEVVQAAFETMSGELPSPSATLELIRERLLMTSELNEQEWQELCDFILKNKGPHLTEAEVRNWSYEYVATVRKSEIVTDLDNIAPSDVSEYLSKAVDDLKSKRPDDYLEDADAIPFSNGLKPKTQLSFIPTGLNILDSYIPGFVAGRMYSYIGFTGGAKTTLSIQLAVTYAEKLAQRWRNNRYKGTLGKVIYVTTEDGRDEIQLRMLACAAQVSRAKLSGESVIPLTTPHTISEQDKSLKNDFDIIYSESERVDMAVKRLHENVRIVDLRDRDVMPKGMHPITYIQQQIKKYLDTDLKADGTRRTHCALIVIDHCEVLINRILAANKNKARWDITDELPVEIRDQLATHYNCPVWVVQQLSGKANEKGVGAGVSHTDAKGSKSWGTYFDACFSVTKLTKDTQQCTLQITKNRYGRLNPDSMLKLHGDICRVEKISDLEYESSDKKQKQRDTYTAKTKYLRRDKKQEVELPDA